MSKLIVLALICCIIMMKLVEGGSIRETTTCDCKLMTDSSKTRSEPHDVKQSHLCQGGSFSGSLAAQCPWCTQKRGFFCLNEMSFHHPECSIIISQCCSCKSWCLPGNLLSTHQPLKILEDGGPRHPERGDPGRGAGGAGWHGWDWPRWTGASPRPDPLVPRPQSHPDSGNLPVYHPNTKGIKSHKPFNSLLLFQLKKKIYVLFFLSAILKNGLCPKNKSPSF